MCEMRFYLPNREEPERDEADNKSKQDDEEEEATPAQVFNELIVKHAGLGDSAKDIIARFHDLPLIVPRGKYTLEMFPTYAKYHGRTHDYKIMYKDIVKVFELPRVDRDQTVILI